MKREISLITFSYILLLLMLILAGMVSGVLSTLIYILAFLAPLFIALWVSRKYREDKNKAEYLTLDLKWLSLSLTLIFPLVLTVFLISYLTSLIMMKLTGNSGAIDIGGSFIAALFNHAFLPTILEELLFRYLPMKLLLKRSGKVTVIISALFFALVHHSFYSIPYAFVAGIVFILIDIAAGSVLPSVILHFSNNLFSIIWSMYIEGSGREVLFFAILGISAVLSLTVIFLLKNKYLEALKKGFSHNEKYIPSYEPLMFILPTIVIAISELMV